MSNQSSRSRYPLQATTVAVFLSALAGCASPEKTDVAAEAKPAVGTLAYDQSVFHEMLAQHDKLRRSVREIDGGIESLTESDDHQLVALLHDHVRAMKSRMESGRRIRQWDPIFAVMFDHRKQVRIDIAETDTGVRVRETSDDPKVAALIQSHAKVVSAFVANGFDETSKEHPLPASTPRP